MQKQNVSDYDTLNTEKECHIKRSDLPLSCPSAQTALWCAHPKVFIPIETSESKTARCPYCSTLYRLID